MEHVTRDTRCDYSYVDSFIISHGDGNSIANNNMFNNNVNRYVERLLSEWVAQKMFSNYDI